jgi:signal transduction histidine kinase
MTSADEGKGAAQPAAAAARHGASAPEDRAASTGPWRSWPGAIALFALIAAAHAAGAAVAYHLHPLTSAGEVRFPAAGVTVAALLLVPRRWWWIVLSAAFASELITALIIGEAVLAAAGLALAKTVGPAVGAALVLRIVHGPVRLSRRRDLSGYVLGAAVAGPVLGALIGAAATRFTQQHGAFVTVFTRWWTGTGLNVLIAGSLLLAWLVREPRALRSRFAVAEGSALAIIVIVTTWLVFWRWPLPYLALVPLGWAAIRFGPRGAATAGAAITVIAEWATDAGHGPFDLLAGHDHNEALWLLQLFLAVTILGGLTMAAAVAEGRRADAARRASEIGERDARQAATEAHAAERTSLARELHDSVSQALFSMTMHARTAQIALAREGVAEESPAGRAIGQLHVLTAGALAEMRALIFELRPGALAEAGLVAALRRQAAAISAREAIEITVDGPESRLGLSLEAEEHCYRLILEAWNNTVKHAGANTITTVIAATDRTVTVEVTDDGRGFEPAAVARGHMGLQTMRERAAVIGAVFELATSPGRGTTIRLRVPQTHSPEAMEAPTAASAEGASARTRALRPPAS